MKSMPIGRKKFATCLDDKSQKQKEQIRGYTEDQQIKVRRELEKRKDKWLKDKIKSDKERVKRWEDELAEDATAPI